LAPFPSSPREHPPPPAHLIDSPVPAGADPADLIQRWADRLLAELASAAPETTVAHRGAYRWVPTFQPVTAEPGGPPLRQGGVYWITGGLGRVGLALAAYLARTVGAKLVLT